MIHIADTHALAWFLEGNSRLSQVAEHALRDNAVQLAIPSIVLAEISFLYARPRIATSVSAIFSQIHRVSNWLVYPLDEQVVEHLPTDLDIHDAIIVATALLLHKSLGEQVAVISRDADIASSGLVPVVW